MGITFTSVIWWHGVETLWVLTETAFAPAYSDYGITFAVIALNGKRYSGKLAPWNGGCKSPIEKRVLNNPIIWQCPDTARREGG